MDKPHLLTVCVVGDGESETGCVSSDTGCNVSGLMITVFVAHADQLPPLGMDTSTLTRRRVERSCQSYTSSKEHVLLVWQTSCLSCILFTAASRSPNVPSRAPWTTLSWWHYTPGTAIKVRNLRNRFCSFTHNPHLPRNPTPTPV